MGSFSSRRELVKLVPRLNGNASMEVLWSQQLRYQRDVTSGQDLAFLYNQPAWRQARTILEVGCGTGAFLEVLANHFPKKKFVGVDLRGAALRSARYVSERTPNVTFKQRNLHDLRPSIDGKFDFIIARLVVQHLPSAEHFLTRMAGMLNAGGTLFVYDANDQLMLFFPELPLVQDLFSQLAKKQLRLGLGRSGWRKVEKVGRAFHFQMEHSANVICPSTTTDGKTNLYKMFANIAPLAVGHFGLSMNLADYQRQLKKWYVNPTSYGQFAMRATLLEKRGSWLSSLFGPT